MHSQFLGRRCNESTCLLRWLGVTVILLAGAAYAQTGTPTLIAHAGTSGGTTAAVDTTGANFALVCAPGGHKVSDSNANTWQYLEQTEAGGFAGSNVSMYIAFNLHTSATHTFTVSDRVPFTVMAFSHIASGPDKVSVANTGGYPQIVGPITPSNKNEIVLGCTNGNMNPAPTPATVVVNSPFKVTDIAVSPSGAWPDGTSSAYAFFATPSATSLDFNANQRNGQISNIASFYSDLSPIPPNISMAVPLPEASLGSAYPAVCPSVAGGVRPFSFAVAGTLPEGVRFDKATGCLSAPSPASAVTDAPLTITVTDAHTLKSSVSTQLSVAAKPITLTGSACPVAKQLQPFTCNALHATGGIGTLHYATSSDPKFMGMPGGLNVDTSTGTISSSRVTDQGDYSEVGVSAYDDHGGKVLTGLKIYIDGDNSFGGVKLFPDDSVYHLKVRDLPKDTHPAETLAGFLSGVPLKAEFGPGTETGGIPVNTYPANTPFVSVKADNGGNRFTSGPIPCDSGMEADRNQIALSEHTGEPDLHVLGVYLPGVGADGKTHPARLYEMYNVYPSIDSRGNCSWGNPFDSQGGGYGSSVLPPPAAAEADADLQSTHSMPLPGATTDAAGLPVTANLLTYDEVAGGCPKGHECGVIRHAIRITVNHLSQFYQWPATASAPDLTANCPVPGSGLALHDIQPFDQEKPPTCFANGGPLTQAGQIIPIAGQILRLPLTTAEPHACSSNPVNHIIFTALTDYGLIIADRGLSGALVGTKDHRWPDWGTLNSCLNAIRMGQLEVVHVSQTAADPSYRSNQIKRQYVVNAPQSVK